MTLSVREVFFSFFVIISFGVLTFCADASSAPLRKKHDLPWLLEVGIGYSYYRSMLGNDGLTSLARLGVAKEFFSYNDFYTGIEFAAQSGNTGKLKVRQTLIDSMGGLSVFAYIKPMTDLLLTERIYFLKSHQAFALIKAGAALRQIEFDRTTINETTQINPEVQFGFGYQVNQLFSFALLYQKIISGSSVISEPDEDSTAKFSNIPGQCSFMLAVTINLQGAELR